MINSVYEMLSYFLFSCMYLDENVKNPDQDSMRPLLDSKRVFHEYKQTVIPMFQTDIYNNVRVWGRKCAYVTGCAF